MAHLVYDMGATRAGEGRVKTRILEHSRLTEGVLNTIRGPPSLPRGCYNQGEGEDTDIRMCQFNQGGPNYH